MKYQSILEFKLFDAEHRDDFRTRKGFKWLIKNYHKLPKHHQEALAGVLDYAHIKSSMSSNGTPPAPIHEHTSIDINDLRPKNTNVRQAIRWLWDNYYKLPTQHKEALIDILNYGATNDMPAPDLKLLDKIREYAASVGFVGKMERVTSDAGKPMRVLSIQLDRGVNRPFSSKMPLPFYFYVSGGHLFYYKKSSKKTTPLSFVGTCAKIDDMRLLYWTADQMQELVQYVNELSEEIGLANEDIYTMLYSPTTVRVLSDVISFNVVKVSKRRYKIASFSLVKHLGGNFRQSFENVHNASSLEEIRGFLRQFMHDHANYDNGSLVFDK